jgi:hypothetical protein
MRNVKDKILFAVVVMFVSLLGACAASSSKELVGSSHVISKTTPAMVVESVDIAMPFNGVVHDGSPREILIKGEDNLLSQLTIRETSVSNWQIKAPPGLMFTQHSDFQIYVPFVNMVRISYNDGDLTFADQPFEAKRDQADAGSQE